MQAPLKEKNDIKIFILYLMRQVACPLEFSEINDIVVQDGFVSYFDFAECFAELLDAGNVEEIKRSDGTCVYSITGRGIHVADNLKSNLLTSLREKAVRSAFRLLNFERRGIISKSEITPAEDGKYKFSCLISDNGNDILNVNIELDSKQQADRVKYNFDEHTEKVYKSIVLALSGNVNYLWE